MPRAYFILDSAIKELEKVLDGAKSQGMKDVRNFLRNVQQHEVYKVWGQNLSLLGDGAKYVVSFELHLAEGVSNIVQLGIMPPGSSLDELIKTAPGLDGVVRQGLDKTLMVRRFSGLVKSDIGHVIQTSLDFDFEDMPAFCDVLTKEMAGQLSFYAALGHVYKKYEELGIPVCRPIVGEGEGIEVYSSIHPVVAWQAVQKGVGFVLNDFILSHYDNFRIITGPNDGGKTCGGKGWAFDIVSAQSGMMCPAKGVRIGKPVKELYTHFVSKDDIEKGKGRHRNELSRARRICEMITPHDALLFDEPCGGTDSESGIRDSRSLIGYAHAIGLPALFITHLHGLSAAVEEGLWDGIENLQAEIKPDGKGEGELTYRLIQGRAEHSYGSRISREEGVTPEALAALLKARIATGELDPKEIRREEPIF